MTPEQFLHRYHSLEIDDQRLKLRATLKLRKYQAGALPDDAKEAQAVLDTVAIKFCGLKGKAALQPLFTIPKHPGIDPEEQFCANGIVRAFWSRGSPDEIKDALRLAHIAGRTKQLGPEAYGQKWFGQDCNSFVANYLGVSPMLGIPAYPLGFFRGAKTFGTRTRDLDDSEPLLPLPVRSDPASLAPGDVIVTYSSKEHASHHWYWKHIALLEAMQVSGKPSTENGAVLRDAHIRIVEWGGGNPAHHAGTYQIRLVTDLLKWQPKDTGIRKTLDSLRRELPNRTLVGWVGSDPHGFVAIRFFIDASPLDWVWHRGHHVRNWELGH